MQNFHLVGHYPAPTHYRYVPGVAEEIYIQAEKLSSITDKARLLCQRLPTSRNFADGFSQCGGRRPIYSLPGYVNILKRTEISKFETLIVSINCIRHSTFFDT